jgi:hypothetical protein
MPGCMFLMMQVDMRRQEGSQVHSSPQGIGLLPGDLAAHGAQQRFRGAALPASLPLVLDTSQRFRRFTIASMQCGWPALMKHTALTIPLRTTLVCMVGRALGGRRGGDDQLDVVRLCCVAVQLKTCSGNLLEGTSRMCNISAESAIIGGVPDLPRLSSVNTARKLSHCCCIDAAP